MPDEELPAEAGDAAGEAAAGAGADSAPDGASDGAKGGSKNPVRRLTYGVLGVIVLLFGWHIAADRYTPYTDLGQVDGYVIPIASQVSGYVSEVHVVLNEVVEEGDVILRINPIPYQLAVNTARANLELSGQQVRAQTSAIEAAAGRLGVARARLDRAQRYYNRVEQIAAQNPGALSQADRDAADTQLAQAQANVISSEAELDRARETLGVEGEENPAIRAAVAALEQAEFDLENTTIVAPGLGVIGDLRLAEGHFANPGQPLATFISAQDVWVRADMRENNLGHIDVGDRADVVLDVAPGRVFKARVASVAAGVATDQASAARGELPTVSQAQGWLRDPQRFPVILRFEDDDAMGFRRAGGHANVIIYTGSNWLLNSVAWIRIRLATLVSFVR